METITLKIEAPNGYQIDWGKSTFENIVFMKVDNVVIKWNKCHNGVEIKADGEHFLLDASSPSYSCSWDDAMRVYDNLQFWKLPTIKQLQVICKYFDKINNIIKENGGFVLLKDFYWSIEERNEFYAWYVNMSCRSTYYGCKDGNIYVRAVSTL